MKVKLFQYPKNPSHELQDLKSDMANHVELEYQYLISEPQHRIFMSPEIYRLQDSTGSYPTIRTETDSVRGIEGYKYKYRDQAKDSKWISFFTGQVHRYLVSPGEKKFVDFSDHVENPYYMKFFKEDRILVRRVVSRRNRLQASVASGQFVVGKDLYSLVPNENAYERNYLLALLNCTLISYLYYMRSTVAQKDDFRQTTLDEVRAIPLAPAEKNVQQRIAQLVDELIQLKKEIVDIHYTEDLRVYFHTQPTAHQASQS